MNFYNKSVLLTETQKIEEMLEQYKQVIDKKGLAYYVYATNMYAITSIIKCLNDTKHFDGKYKRLATASHHISKLFDCCADELFKYNMLETEAFRQQSLRLIEVVLEKLQSDIILIEEDIKEDEKTRN